MFRGGQPAKRLYVELVGLSRGDRWLVEDTRRDLNILCPQSSEDFTGAQIVGRDFIRIEPDTHRIFAAAYDLHVADARQARKQVLDVQGCIVRNIEHVARAIRRIKVNCQQDVGRRLPHLHAEALHILGQSGQGVLHAVLRQHLRDIEVGPNSERHGYRELAIPRRLAAHVQHAFNAVDLLLERRCNGPRNGLRGRARVGRCDLDRGRHDLRILRNRQDDERTKSDQRHEDAQDGGEDRPVDEAV